MSDLIMVLSTLGVEGDEALAVAVPEIDVIVGGRTRRIRQPTEIVDDTVIVQMGHDGERLGRLGFGLDEQGCPRSPEVVMLSLSLGLPDDPTLAALIRKHKARLAPPTVPPAG